MKSKYDIIVVGGGPGGSMAAKYAAENGADVCLLEKTRENKLVYNSNCLEGNFNLIYRANEEILNPETDLEMTSEAIKLKDYPDIKI